MINHVIFFPLSNIFERRKAAANRHSQIMQGWHKETGQNTVHVSQCPAVCSSHACGTGGMKDPCGMRGYILLGARGRGHLLSQTRTQGCTVRNYKFKEEIFFFKGWTELKILHIPCSGVGFCGIRECMAKATVVWRLFLGKSQPGL